MRYRISLSLTVILFCSPLSFAKELSTNRVKKIGKIESPKVDRRYFSFPSDYPIGTLQLMDYDKAAVIKPEPQIATARGSLVIDVPHDKAVLLTINPQSLEHPERLKNIQTAGIEGLKITYLSTDEDSSICDAALKALPEFKNLVGLLIDRSDVTDKGISDFKSLKSVEFFSAYFANLDGSIFKETEKLKNLEKLNLVLNPIKSENLKYLSALPHLHELILGRLSLSDSDLSNLAKCTQIKRLYINDNSKITDKSLPILQRLTGLEFLNVRGTKITLDGVLSLKNLKLEELMITVRRYRPNELEQLTTAFPKAFINHRGVGIGEENQTFFAPLK